jgi:CRISPR-associated protein Cas2
MMILVSYDVKVSSNKGEQRLRKIAKELTDHGQRVQFSVFECIVDPAQWITLKNRLKEIMNEETDSLRFYYLGKNWQRKIEHFGAKEPRDITEPIII